MKVLIVEDNAASLWLMSEALHQGGHDVVLATTLGQAVRLFQETRPDAVAIDACLGSKKPNSLGFVKFMRHSYTGPIIAISGSKRYNELLLQAGCSHACTKTTLTELIQQLSL